jgi:hypothetical protein
MWRITGARLKIPSYQFPHFLPICSVADLDCTQLIVF